MKKMQERLNKLGITIRELSLYEGVEDSILEKSINLYNEDKNIPESLKEDFDFIMENEPLSKNQIIYHLMRFEDHCSSSEEKPFVKKLFYQIRAFNIDEILDDLKKNNIEVIETSNRIWQFSLFISNICIYFKLVDERLNYLNDESHKLVSESLPISSYEEILDILSKIKKLYGYSKCQLIDLDMIIKQNEDTVSAINEIQDYEESEEDRVELPPWDNGDNDGVEKVVLLKDLQSMINDCINLCIDVDIKNLREFKEFFMELTPKYQIVWRGKKYAILKRRKDNQKILCVETYPFDFSAPIIDDDFVIDGKMYYPIKEAEYGKVEELYEKAKFLDNY